MGWQRRRRPGVWAALVAVTALGVIAGTVGRLRLEQFATPGMAVARAAAQSALRSAPRYASQIWEKVGRAGRPRSTDAVQPAPQANQESAPGAAAKAPAAAARVAASPTATATLTITSTPRQARVQIDGAARGVTPVTISRLRAGPHNIRISHPGHRSVTRTITLDPGKKVALDVRLPVQAPPSGAAPAPPTAPVRPQTAAPLDVGRLAPQFVAKDRIGLLYRTADYRGRKLTLVFVQSLDGNAQRIIRELNAQAGDVPGTAVVVVLRPDRAAIRQFTQSAQIKIPVLFGTPALARAYGVGSQTAVLYIVSGEGRVVLRQVGRVNPNSALN